MSAGRAPAVAIVGPGENVPDEALRDAESVGELAAREGWIVITGGRAAGVMQAAARGARQAKGLVIGLLPGSDATEAAPECSVLIPTGLGEARNVLVALAGDVMIACGMNPGTASEIAFAIKANKPIVFVRPAKEVAAFFVELGGDLVTIAENATDAIARARSLTATHS